jgi:uncharacterized membrane protein
MVKNFLVTLIIFLGIDFVWLGLIAKNFYDQQLSAFSRTLNWPAAILTYLLIALGLVLFVLPQVKNNGFQAIYWGAIFGLIVYGVYDLVNLATLADWTLKMTLVDVFWGMFVCGATAYLASQILGYLK